MKIAISSAGGSIHAEVEPRFGRAPYYVVVDSETMKFDLVFNPNTLDEHGVGPQTASLIAETGAQVLLTGQVGPNAARALSTAGIQVVTGISGKVKDVVDAYLKK
ncbi:MAG: NifB/NifX family molybdenum-iron cluster-binding protein [Deltaproteobacteria bacterium]|nr:NifB/NifX family molybdenum-iron cluster-binding protein [Deltaproteobacteria bacterium]